MASAGSCIAFQAVMIQHLSRMWLTITVLGNGRVVPACSQIGIITEHPQCTEIRMREKSILALKAGSSSTSQAVPVMLNHDDTYRSNFFVYAMVGADYQKQREPTFFQGCNLHILSVTKQGNKHYNSEEKALSHGQTTACKRSSKRWDETKFYWSKCMAFIRCVNKARCLSHPLKQITVTANANKREGNVAFVRKDEKE